MDNEYYILKDKTPIPVDDFMEWAKWNQNADRTVKKTEIGDIIISTVFLGLNHSFDAGTNKPLLFETMIFGGELDGDMWRYSTWEEAEEGHEKAVQLVKEKLNQK
jgi:hypothetical protein